MRFEMNETTIKSFYDLATSSYDRSITVENPKLRSALIKLAEDYFELIIEWCSEHHESHRRFVETILTSDHIVSYMERKEKVNVA